MKILFIDSDPHYFLGLPSGLKNMGCQVTIINDIVEEELDRTLAKDRPDLLLTTGRTKIHTDENLKVLGELVKKYQLKHAYWATEDPRWTDEWSLPYIEATHPRIIFSIDRNSVSIYRKRGLSAYYLPWACNPEFHKPVMAKNEYKCDIAVVATAGITWNSYRKDSAQILLKPLVESGYNVLIWGDRWDTFDPSIVGFNVDASHLRGKLSYLETNHVYNSAKIVLGFQNVTDELTSRTYEILGAGGFLLTVNTEAVREIFKPGEHLEVSQTPVETLKLVDYYLRNEKKRKLIALKGQHEVYSYPNTYNYRAEQILYYTALR